MKGSIPIRAVMTQRTRRKRPSAAAAAYSLSLTVLRHPPLAESVAVSALRKGARSRTGVLAHARFQSVRLANSMAQADPEVVAAEDARELAQQLAATRPPIERAIVDLELRFGLDTASFARCLGLPIQLAAGRARSIATTWSNELDPAVLAWLGPAACDELAAILTNAGVWPHTVLLPATGTDGESAEPIEDKDAHSIQIQDLLDVGPAVTEHAQHCHGCAERLKSMTPVRTLVGQQPPDTVPPAVAEAARSSYKRLPGPLPPSIEPRRLELQRLRSVAISAVVAVGLIGGLFGAMAVALNDDEETQADRVARLINAAPASRLLATPTIMNAEAGTAALANSGTESILWHATTSAQWLTVSPTSGRLAPAQSVSIAIDSEATPRSGAAEATIMFTGSDGSTQTIRFEGSNDRSGQDAE
jgi:type II secretory pathway pseudopilin PulG